MRSRATWSAALLLAAACASAAGSLWWLATQSSRIKYIPSQRVGEWIVPDWPMETGSHLAVPLDYRFERDFQIDSLPAEVVLEVCSPAITRIRVNDREVAHLSQPDGRAWKVPSRYDVTRWLKSGSNRLSIDVLTDEMVPALWARLNGGQIDLCTDKTWSVEMAGAGRTNVVFARDILVPPAYLTSQLGLPDLRSAVQHSGLAWLLLVAASAVVCILSLKLFARRPLRALIVSGIAIWTILFSLNAVTSLAPIGFDHLGHLDYIEFVRSGRGLPLAEDGWEMFQPPLYYLTAAHLLRMFGATTDSMGGILLLRIMGYATGIVTWLLVLACLRELFPEQNRRIVFGSLIAICVPAHICTAHYVTNEGFTAAWCCGAILCGLRILRSQRCPVWLAIALGICLGGALLSKSTAVLTALAIFTAIALRLVFQGDGRGPRPWLISILLPAVVCLALCGWHYTRVWTHYGNPFITNNDPAVGTPWWQDPGFRSRAYYARFGRCLWEPFFCGSWSLLDGYYGTLWGDSQLSGVGGPLGRPPWNYELMVLGYWLALLPTLGILTGCGSAVAYWCRVRDPRWFLVLAIAMLMVTAMGYMNLAVPVWCQARAAYGLSAQVAFCAFAGWGIDRLAGRRGFRRWAVNIGVAAWVATALATFAIVPQTAPALSWRSKFLKEQGRVEEATRVAERAMQANPACKQAMYMLTTLNLEAGLKLEAVRVAERAVREQSGSFLAYEFASATSLNVGRTADGIRYAHQAVSMAPRNPRCHIRLGIALLKANRYPEVFESLQRALQLNPTDVASRKLIAQLYEQMGHDDLARQHRRRLPSP